MGVVGSKIARGSFWLSSGNILATLIAFAGSIVIARLLTPDEYGLISAALIYPGMLIGLLDLGLNAALLRYSASRDSRVVGVAMLFKIIVAVASAMLLYMFAEQMALSLNRPGIEFYIRILSIYAACTIVAEASIQVLIGLNRYMEASLMYVLRNVVRIVTAVALIVMGLGVYGAIWGFSAAGIAMIIYVSILYPRELKPGPAKSVFRELIAYSLPLYIPVVLGMPLNQVANIFLARRVSNFELGNYSVATNFTVIISIIGGAITTSLFSVLPSINSREKARVVVEKATRYTTLIMVSLALGLVVLAKPIVYLVYGHRYAEAPLYLALLALTPLLAPLGTYVVAPFLNSIGKTRDTMKINLVYQAVFVPLAVALIQPLGVTGLIISLLLGNLASALYGVRLVERDYGIKIVKRDNLLLLVKACIPAVLTFSMLHYIQASITAQLLIRALVYALSLTLIVSRTLRDDEIIELENMTKSVKVLSIVLNPLFKLVLMLNRVK